MECRPLRLFIEKRKLEDNKFLAECLEFIENHDLFKHPFFSKFEENNLDMDQIKHWAKQRKFTSKLFPCFMGDLISHIEDIEARHPYITQMYEEHGEGDPKEVHYYQLCHFIKKLGVSQGELDAEVMTDETRDFIESYVELTESEDYIRGMGAFALGSEPVIAMEMELCLKGIDNLEFLEEHDIYYFIDHGRHDYRHTFELMDSIMPYILTGDQQKRAFEGMKMTMDARKRFYDGAYLEKGVESL